jgi:hypothetical protein
LDIGGIWDGVEEIEELTDYSKISVLAFNVPNGKGDSALTKLRRLSLCE